MANTAAKSYYTLGCDAFGEKDYESAIKHLNDALEIDSKYVDALKMTVSCFIHLGRHAEALRTLNRMLIIKPKDAMLWHVRGSILKKLGREQEADESYKKALELNPRINIQSQFAFKAVSPDGELCNFEVKLPDEMIDGIIEERLKKQRKSAREKMLYGLKKIFLTFLWPFIFASRHWKTISVIVGLIIFGFITFEFVQWRRAMFVKKEGINYEHAGNYDEALKHFDKVLAMGSRLLLLDYLVDQDEELWSFRGTVFMGLKRYNEAIACFNKVVGLNPNDIKAWYYRGECFYNLGQYEEALRSYDSALKLKEFAPFRSAMPDWAQKGKEKAEKAIGERKKEEESKKYYDLGYKAFENGLYQESVENYSRALAISPENVSALIGRCAGFIWLKKYDEAMQDCNKVLVNDSDNVITLTNICLIFEHEENYVEALQCSDKVSAICQKRKCSDEIMKKFNGIKEYSKKKIAEREEKKQAEEKRKQEELERQRQEEEMRKQAVRAKWDEAARLQSKGYSFLKSGKYRKAIGFFDQALLADPDNVFARFNKGVVLYQLGKHDEAIKIFDEAVSAHHRCRSTAWPSQRSDCFDEDEIMKAKDNTVRRISEIEEEKELAERRAQETRIKAEEETEKRKAEAEKRRVEEEEQKKREEDARGWREMREGAERIAKWQIDSKLPILIERYGSSIGETGDGHKLGQICRERCQQDIKVEGEKCRDRATVGMDPLDPSYDYQRWIAPCYSIETKPNTLNCQCAEDYRKILDISKRYNY